MDIVSLIISLISGAVGGNVAGAAMPKDKNLGAAANSIIGLLGGGAGDFLLKALGVLATTGAAGAMGMEPTGGEFDIASLLATIGVSGVSGGVITAIISLIKAAMQK